MVNLQKTKAMVTGWTATEDKKAPLHLGEDEVVKYVNVFTYLGSKIAESGRMTSEVDRRIKQASKAFGSSESSVCR